MGSTSPTPRFCARCGAELDSYAPEGQCPQCMLKAALASVAASRESAANSVHAEDRAAPSDPAASASSYTNSSGGFPSAATGPQRFGDYELLEEIAHGGMGIVYRARQISLDRVVAVKRLLLGALASPEYVQRFRTEAAAAASLQHPNIVAIHEVGFHDGQHFFAMDYVAGRSLAEIVRDGPLPGRRAAGYVKTIAQAIQYAHERNILHRDLKPSNVLIDEHDQPRVTDFGLAKRLEKDSDLTLSGQVLGSPSYMPPEQAAAHRGLVSKRSDVYSLGAILYHLLTGRPPFVAPTVAETLQQVQNAEPVSPTILHPGLPRDLRTICLKCLEKEPARRYGSAQELADELGRFLNQEPIQARPVSRPEKAWRWCRRKPLVASLSAAVAVVFVTGFAGVLWQWQQSEKHHALAEANLYAAEMNLAHQAWEEGDLARAQRLLIAHEPGPKQEDLRGFEWRYLWNLCQDESRTTFTTFTNPVGCVRFSPDGQTFAAASGKTVKLWDFAERRELGTLEGHSDLVVTLAFCPSRANLLASAGSDQTIILWDLTTKTMIGRLAGHSNRIGSIVFSPDGKTLASGSDDFTTKLWDVQAQRLLRTLKGQEGLVLGLAFSPDGTTLASGGGDVKVRLWDVLAGKEVGRLDRHTAFVGPLAFSGDGRTLATAGNDSTIVLWDLASRQGSPPLLGHNGPVKALAFSPDDRLLATGGSDNTIRIWDVERQRQIAIRRGHKGAASSLVFSPDGLSLVSGSADGTVKIWDLPSALEGDRNTLRGHESWVEAVAFSPDAKALASLDFHAYVIKLWDVPSRRFITNLSGHTSIPNCAAFSPDGTLLATGSFDRTVGLWNLRENTLLASLQHRSRVKSVSFALDGTTLVSAGGSLRFWNVASQQEVQPFKKIPTNDCMAALFSADGRVLATIRANGKVSLWDLHSGKERVSFLEPQWANFACSSNGLLLAVGKNDGSVALCDASKHRVTRLRGHTAAVVCLAFAPDGKTLASASHDGTVKLWKVTTGQVALTLKHVGAIAGVAFSPDGNFMATCGADTTVKLWPAAPMAGSSPGPAASR